MILLLLLAAVITLAAIEPTTKGCSACQRIKKWIDGRRK